MNTMTLEQRLTRLLAALNPTDTWIRCPSCARESNKLAPCHYAFEGQILVTHLCPRCAEGRPFEKYGYAKVWDWLQDNYPNPGFNVRQEPKRECAFIEAGGVTYRVWWRSHEPSTIHARMVGGKLAPFEDWVYSDNIVSAWMKIYGDKTKAELPQEDLLGFPTKRFKRL